MIATLVELGLSALGLVGALGLFLSLKRELRSQARKSQARIDQLAEQLRETKKPAAEALMPEVVTPEVVTIDAAPAPVPAALRSGMNINRRVQAMRMLRRGEDLGHVAAALGIPRREVELLVRVHQISAAGAGS